MKTLDIELAVANYLNIRANLIVPNVHWSFFQHECDLLVITKAGYAWEIEIKVTKSDLIKDKEKWKWNVNENKIKCIYFAIPEKLEPHIEHIPDQAGIIVVFIDKWDRVRCKTIRQPKYVRHPYKFSLEERYQVARLGALRLWGLKTKIDKLNKKMENNK